MPGFDLLVAVALGYVAFLFAIAFLAERRAGRGRDAWLRGPVVYTLSLSIYCTAWTFYGAVGNAARSGLEYLTIYLGPSLVMLGWWWMLRKLVRVGRAQRITSIADLVSSRFGKSAGLGGIVTVMCVVGVAPYIALQLQSITLSFAVFAEGAGRVWGPGDIRTVALASAAGLASFAILFGTRNLDADERHHGVVLAIAVEAVVKLAALLAVGGFVVWGIGGGVGETLERIDASAIARWDQGAGRWIGLTMLSAAAFVCLPRMFQVLVVENADEGHLRTASWAFPLYLMAMSLFVVPIAVTGLALLPEGNPDLFVLTVPLSQGEGGLATLAFLGGFSSATSMVIVATIALATMVSNHVVLPIWLRARGGGATMSGDVRAVTLRARRASIAGVLGLGYLYFRVTGGGAALTAIGLISFVGVAQILPAMLGGLFWRGATRAGAASALVTGFAVWMWTMFLPGVGGVMPASVVAEGPFGIAALRPGALFGIAGVDPVLHAFAWSMALNAGVFVAVSLLTFPAPLERLQGAQFVDVFAHSLGPGRVVTSTAQAEDLLIMAQRIVGAGRAQAVFRDAARDQGHARALPDVTPGFVQSLERELAGSVGAATAHAMVGQLTEGAAVSVEDLIAVADEAAQIVEYSNRLEAKSAEQERTARALRDANAKLTALSLQKDAFLGQVSHELRTPMTSIRAFSELLREGGLTPEDGRRYAGIVEDEARRMTRLLDDLLDLSVLEHGQVALRPAEIRIGDLIGRAVAAATGERALDVTVSGALDAVVVTDPDRLAQVVINVVSNAAKYCARPDARLWIEVEADAADVAITLRDDGPGIAEDARDLIFEKFARAGDPARAGGAGLGLAIAREVMHRLGGRIDCLPQKGGAAFRVTLPRQTDDVSGLVTVAV